MRPRIAVAIVDDDDLVRGTLKDLLAEAGLAVAGYASGGAFLAAPEARPNCLVVDYNMPAMNGLELVAALRARGLATPTVLLTGRADAMLRRRAAQFGVAVLEKPVSGARLLGAIDAALAPGRRAVAS